MYLRSQGSVLEVQYDFMNDMGLSPEPSEQEYIYHKNKVKKQTNKKPSKLTPKQHVSWRHDIKCTWKLQAF